MILRIDGLRFYAYHGVLPREQKVGQQFQVDVELEVADYDGSDSLDKTVNYADVIKVVKEEMDIPSRLIEHVAVRIAKSIGSNFRKVSGGFVTMRKLHPPVEAELASVEVTVEIP